MNTLALVGRVLHVVISRRVQRVHKQSYSDESSSSHFPVDP